MVYLKISNKNTEKFQEIHFFKNRMQAALFIDKHPNGADPTNYETRLEIMNLKWLKRQLKQRGPSLLLAISILGVIKWFV